MLEFWQRSEVILKIFGKEIKLLITDVDGVLLDLNSRFENNIVSAALKMGLDAKPAIKYVKGMREGEKPTFSHIDLTLQKLWPNLNDKELKKLKEIFTKNEEKNPYPAIPWSTTAIFLFQRLIPVAICTNNRLKLIERRLKRVGFNMCWFSFVSSWENGHPKPDLRALTIITDSLKTPKENALFIGDWYPDWECAQNAGVEFAAVTSGGIPKHAFLREGVKEDHIFETIFDITQIVKP